MDYQTFKGLMESYQNVYSEGSYQIEEDFYDVVLEYLCSEGYADTLDEAEYIMANKLSLSDIDYILEAKYGTKKGRHKLAMKIRRGEEIGKKNVPGKTGFKAVEAKAKKYGATNPAAVAAAAMWKKYGK